MIHPIAIKASYFLASLAIATGISKAPVLYNPSLYKLHTFNSFLALKAIFCNTAIIS